jgi:hypothetical protein
LCRTGLQLAQVHGLADLYLACRRLQRVLAEQAPCGDVLAAAMTLGWHFRDLEVQQLKAAPSHAPRLSRRRDPPEQRSDMQALLDAAIADRLRRLPLRPDGFWARTKRSLVDWAFLGVVPVSDFLEAVIEQRATEITDLIIRSRLPAPVAKPSEAERAVMQKFHAFARAWYDLPASARPRLDWGWLKVDEYAATKLSVVRSFRAWAREDAKRITKSDVGVLLADTYLEVTGRNPSHHSSQPTPFDRSGIDIFDIGALGDWRAVGSYVMRRFRARTAK